MAMTLALARLRTQSGVRRVKASSRRWFGWSSPTSSWMHRALSVALTDDVGAIPGAGSDIMFAQTREDPVIDDRVVRHVAKRTGRTDLRVLVLGSGGCTPLSLLSRKGISEIHAIDANKAQLHLVRLKLALIRSRKPLQEQLDFLGATAAALPLEKGRLQCFNDIRHLLPPDTAAYWESKLDHIEAGVNRTGRFEAIFRELATEARKLGLDPLSRPHEAITHKEWNPLFERVFARDKLISAFGEDAVNYSMSRPFSSHFAERFAHALESFSPERNYFLRSVWADCYPSAGGADQVEYQHLVRRFRAVDANSDGYVDAQEFREALEESGDSVDSARADALIAALGADGKRVSLEEFLQFMYTARDFSSVPELESLLVRQILPPYLQPALQKRSVSLGLDRLHLHEGMFGDRVQDLSAAVGGFDMIQTSNITDWMPAAEAHELFETLNSCLRPGGAVLARRLNGDYKLDKLVSDSFSVDSIACKGLESASRCHFYNEVVVGVKEDRSSRTSFSGTDLSADKHPWWRRMAKEASEGSPLVKHLQQHRNQRPTPSWLTVEDLTSMESFDDAVFALERAYDFRHHPYIEWMQASSTTREVFRETQAPFKYAVERWSQSVAALLAKIPTTPGRLEIYENLAEEHGYGTLANSHVATFGEFLTALGVPESTQSSLPVPIHIHAFNEALIGWCLARSANGGASALGMIEDLYVTISEEISTTIVGRNWVEPDSQRHYAVHAELDIQHAKDLLDVARPGWDESPASRHEVASGLLLASHHFWTVYAAMLTHGKDLENSAAAPLTSAST